MTTVNNPIPELIEVRCFKCNMVFKVHPMQNATSPYITDCDLHKEKEIKQ